MEEDFWPWFPFKNMLIRSGSEDTFASIYLSRVDIEPFFPSGTMSDAERIRSMPKGSPPTRLLFPNGIEDVPSIDSIVSDISLFVSGLKDPEPFERKGLGSQKLLRPLSRGKVAVEKKAAKKKFGKKRR